MAHRKKVEENMNSNPARTRSAKKPAWTVLTVDDDAAVRDLLRDALRHQGYRVCCAGSGAEALATLRREHVDLVLLDLGMPGLTGFQVLERIGRMPRPPKVVVLTGFGDLDSVREVMRLGAFDYLTKPCDLEYIGRVIGAALEPVPECVG